MRAGPGAIAMALVLGACSAAGSDGGAPTTTSGSIPAARSACEAIADLDDVASVVAEYETADGLTQALTAAEAVFAAAQAEHDTAIGAAQDARDHRRLAVDAATVARQALTSTGNFPIVLAYRTGTVSEELGRVPTEADIARIEDEGERLQAAVDQAEQEEDEARSAATNAEAAEIAAEAVRDAALQTREDAKGAAAGAGALVDGANQVAAGTAAALATAADSAAVAALADPAWQDLLLSLTALEDFWKRLPDKGASSDVDQAIENEVAVRAACRRAAAAT